MKNYIHSIILEIRYPLLLVYLAVWIMLIIGNAGTVDNITDLIGGIEISQMQNDVNLLAISQWLLIISPAILAVGYNFSQELTIAYMTLFRCKNWFGWWSRRVVAVGVFVILYLVIGFVVMAPFLPNTKWDALALILLGIHIYFLAVMMITLNMIAISSIFSVLIVLLCDGISYIFAAITPAINAWLPGVWGMFKRSDIWASNYGFSYIAITIIQVLLISFALFIIPSLIRKNGISIIHKKEE